MNNSQIRLATDEQHARMLTKQWQARGYHLVDARAVDRTALWLWFRKPSERDTIVRVVTGVYRATGNYSEETELKTHGQERQERTIERLLHGHEGRPDHRDDEIVYMAPATDRIVYIFVGKYVVPKRTAVAAEPELEPEPKSEPRSTKRSNKRPSQSETPRRPPTEFERLDAAASIAIGPTLTPSSETRHEERED